MTTIRTLEVRKDDLSKTRVTEHDVSALADGQVLCAIDRFGLSANNITYGVVGEKIGYWQFFPAEDGWGVIPTWGFADVVESKHPDVAVGERLYGYWPMGTHLVIEPGKVGEARLVDGIAHRSALPPVYNSYARCSHEPHYEPALDDARMLLFPLYATSYCLYDYLLDNDFFGAAQVIIPSASSKTAIGLAYALAGDDGGRPVIGLTSSGNVARVESLGLYTQTIAYDDLASVDASVPSVIVDMSGNGAVLAALHKHLGDNMRFTSNVGLTHYDENQMAEGFIAERSQMFFAPAHIQKRTKEWGPGVFDRRAYGFWRDAAVKSADWLRYEHRAGIEALEGAYREVLAGSTAPDVGIIITPGA